jgi:hypothetical protein
MGASPLSLTCRKQFRWHQNRGWHHGPGISPGVTRLLPGRCPAYRQHDPSPGFRMEHVKACPDTAAGLSGAIGRTPSGENRKEQSTVAGCAGGLARSSCEVPAYRSGGGAKGRGRPGERVWSTGREESHERAEVSGQVV